MSIPWSTSQAVFPSAARTTTQTSADIPVPYAREIDVITDQTVNAGSAGSVTVTINGKDPASGKYYPLLVGAAIAAVGTQILKLGLGLPVTANVSADCGIPPVIQIVVTAVNANITTWSCGLNMIS